MRRREFRPGAVSGGSLRLRGAGRLAVRSGAAGGGWKLRSPLLVAGTVMVVAVVAWVGVQLLRPVPSMTLAASVTAVRALPGVAPRPDWPGRAEAAVGLPVTGPLGAHGGSRPVPIASLAKIMTADMVLRGRPLPAAGPGPVIAVAAADAADYARDQRQGQSVVKVAAGEKLTGRQALEAMLIPSGNNIASLLARWDAGSEAAFVAKMNARARLLGLRAIEEILEQGEGPRGHWRNAHFGQFVTMLEDYQRLRAANPGFDPVRPVLPANVRPPERGTDIPLIGDPLTARVTDLFNVGYEILLQIFERFFAHTEQTDAELQALADATVAIMLRVIKPLGDLITTLPVGEEHPAMTAGPSFELFYESDYRMPHREAAWALLAERLDEA